MMDAVRVEILHLVEEYIDLYSKHSELRDRLLTLRENVLTERIPAIGDLVRRGNSSENDEVVTEDAMRRVYISEVVDQLLEVRALENRAAAIEPALNDAGISIVLMRKY